MEKSKIDLYLTTNAKYFEASAIPTIRQQMEDVSDETLLTLQITELKDPTTVLIISILLGTFGIDRFMIGDIKMGILKLLTGGLCGILTIFDWFTISKKTKQLNSSKISMVLNNTDSNVAEVRNQIDNKSEEGQTTLNNNLKKEANEAKDFFVNFFKTPLSEMKKVVSNPKPFFKFAIILLIIWGIFELVIGIIEVAASIAVLSLIIYLLMKEEKKDYWTIASTIIFAKIPVIIASLISLLGYINNQVRVIAVTFSNFAYVISTVLIYFAVKALYSEDDDDKASRTFLKAMAIYFGVVLVLRFFGIMDIYC